MEATKRFDAIVVGAGAAGLMCAIEAGRRGKRVVVLEHADRAGKKILISGGGRCNFTNLYCQPENFISANPHFAKSALARYTPGDFIALLEKHAIPYHEKKAGQLFCDRSARDIVDLLETECQSAGVQIVLNAKINEVRRTDGFVVHSSAGEFHSSALVVATGGLSISKLGATSFGYDLARKFGLKIQPPRPALVPLLFGPEDREHYGDLAGVSTDVIASAGHQAFRESLLITHRGLSGPAILQISSYWELGKPIRIDLAPESAIAVEICDVGERSAAVKSILQQRLPKRFATRWLDLHAPATWTNRAVEEFERQLHQWTVRPEGTEGYEKAEVTAGGVDTGELSSKTMECVKVPGLFFVGEVVDVTGHLGGFNFQWAWASGAAAGRAL